MRNQQDDQRARSRVANARAVGLNFVYNGNVHDESGQSTCCPGCGECLIGRDWYEITAWQLAADGRCGNCRSVIPGPVRGAPGRWGQRRMPIRIGGHGAFAFSQQRAAACRER